ncbi:MAG: hypothetical protein QOD06_2147, partial [Candidatus Binatota bacterium]|nr:hypothetical protein [Candidatus Binatota bacterium]
MKNPRCSILVVLLSFWTATAGAQTIGARWDTPSKLT